MKHKQLEKGNFMEDPDFPGNSGVGNTPLSFKVLISAYAQVQSKVASDITKIASQLSVANPGQFLYLQFAMSKVTQIGDTLSNMISLVNQTISTMVRGQKQ